MSTTTRPSNGTGRTRVYRFSTAWCRTHSHLGTTIWARSGKASNRDTTLFNTYFGVSRYSNLPTFGGVFPDEGTMDNSYHLFSAGGVDWLVLALEFGPRDQVLAWADTVAESFADRHIIVVTHAYMYSDDTLHGSSPSHLFNPSGLPVNNLPGGTNDGQEMWDKFVRKHHNISFVFSGHIIVDGTNDDGTGQLVSVGDNGNLVYQMLANYQRDEFGELSTDGYLRIIEFDRPDPEELWTVSVDTYSPFLDLSRTEPDESFVFEDVDLEFRPSLNETFDGTMDGWTTVDEGGLISPSNWSVQAGQAAQVSNIYGPNGQATDNRQGTFAYWDNPGAFLWEDYTCTLDIRSTDDDGIGFMFRYQDPANYYKLDMDSQRGFATLFKMQGGVETTLATDNNNRYAVGSTMQLEVSAVGSEIRVLLDNNDLFGLVDDDGIPAGTVALYSWGNNGAYFDDVTVAEAPDLLMEEHFDGATAGVWSVVDEGGLLGPSDWRLQSDQYVQLSNIYGPDGQSRDNRVGTFAYWDDPAALLWDDYTCAANVRSTDNDGIGLMFRYQDQGNYYKVEMDNQRGFATLFKMQNGVETTLATDNSHQYGIGVDHASRSLRCRLRDHGPARRRRALRPGHRRRLPTRRNRRTLQLGQRGRLLRRCGRAGGTNTLTVTGLGLAARADILSPRRLALRRLPFASARPIRGWRLAMKCSSAPTPRPPAPGRRAPSRARPSSSADAATRGATAASSARR